MSDPSAGRPASVARGDPSAARPASVGRIRTRLEQLTGGSPIGPLAILFGLNLVDEFDRIAFQTLLPEIRDAFGLSDTAVGAITVLALVFVALMSLPMGVVADRSNRIRVGAGAAMLWGTMSIATGIVPTVALLVVVRLISGTGRVINEVVHPSLLGDYYTPETHPRIFQLHRLANPLSTLLIGVVAGTIGSLLGWQWAFFILAIPTFLLIAAMLRLREPARGESIDAELAAEVEATQDPVPFGEAMRQLGAVKTLRRLWVGSFLLGFGLLSIAAFLSLFFENVYGFGPFLRGVMTSVFGSGTIVGLFVGASLSRRATERDDYPRLATITGLSFVVFAAGVALMALSPLAAMSGVFAFVLAAGFGAFQPAYYPLVGLVAPPRVRSMAYGVAITLVGTGAIFGIPLFSLGETQGYRIASSSCPGSSPSRDSSARRPPGSSVGTWPRPRTRSRSPPACARSSSPRANRLCSSARTWRWPTTRSRSSSEWTWRSATGRSSPSSGRTVPGSRPCSRRSPGSSILSAARSSSTAGTSPTPGPSRPPRRG